MSSSRAVNIGCALGDPKLFRVGSQAAFELLTSDQAVQITIQNVFERSLDQLLGLRFIASNHAIGANREAFVDTLALDAENRLVIVAYEKEGDDSVVNRGVYALDWLITHRADVQWLIQQTLGAEYRHLNWLAPRLLCIAAEFSRYDTHVANQMQRNIELLRYRRFEGDFIMIELIHTQNILRTTRTIMALPPAKPGPVIEEFGDAPPETDETYTIQRKLTGSPQSLLALFEDTGRFLRTIGGDVKLRELKYYHAYRRVQNFACLDLYPAKEKMKVLVRVNPDEIDLEPGFTRDVRRVTHFGTGDLEITLRGPADLARAQPLFLRAYEQI